MFLTEHFNGDPNAVASGLGAWFGIQKQDGSDNFTYADGSIAEYLPFEGFSRLVGQYDICASMTYGYTFDASLGDYVQQLMWDEAFCRRAKMPLCMVDLESSDCVLLGDALTTDVINSTCTEYIRCIDGVLETIECGAGTMFSVNASDFGGDCTDARDVPECDVDECLEEDSCPENWATCTNLIGTHNCTCDDGYTFNDQGSYFNYSTWTCDDVDECAEGIDDCNDVSDCVNIDGGYWCECHEGYYVEEVGGECVDYDECLDGVYYYGDDNINKFTNSSWPPQLLGDPINNITDDTWEFVDGCHADASCTNQPGDYN